MIRGALLTLLSEGPKYGYQLKSEFEASTGAAWALNIGQVYNTLGRMERDGAVEPLGEDDEGRPRYQLSSAGRAELDQWLGGAVERSVASRDEVTMKVLMAAATGVVDPAGPIAVQRAASQRTLQDATAARVAAAHVADRLHLDRLIVTTAAELRWLDIAEQVLEGEAGEALRTERQQRQTSGRRSKSPATRSSAARSVKSEQGEVADNG